MGAKAGKRRRPSGRGRSARQRFALILFGAVFVLLFVVFAIAQGIGAPNVPSGDVAIVQGVPAEFGHISEADFEKAIEQQAAQGKLKKTPRPGSEKYEELKRAAMNELLNEAWLQGEAEELGISVTEKQVETELEKIKKESFPTKAAYQKFLEESHFTPQEVNERVKLQILSTRIQEEVNEGAPEPSSSAISAYYEAEKGTKFTTKTSRDVRVVVNEEKSKVETAKKALEKDNSPASWKKVAAKYSTDATSKSKGGLQAGLTEEVLPPPLKKPIFGSATGELVGPFKYEGNYLLLEVVKLNPEKTKSLAEATSEISSTLSQELQQEFFSEFVSSYQGKWESRTYCASGYEVEQCSNFKGSGHPSTAPPACYEANPKTPATECPAPVTPTQPALPGSVTARKPKGEPFVQRPRPEEPKSPAEEGASEGAATPEGSAGGASEGSAGGASEGASKEAGSSGE